MHIGSASPLSVLVTPVIRFCRCGPRARFALLALAALALFASSPGEARKPAEAPLEKASSVKRVPVDTRRAELRQALSSDDGLYGTAAERRRLSPEERNALNRELRAAMRDVYERPPARGR